MTLGPAARKLVLTIHLVLSVGWIGAVIAYLAVNVAAMSADPDAVRIAWTAMEMIGWWAIVPLAVGSLLSGLLISLGTPWGLFQHYWVLISFLLTLFAVVVLLVHMPDVSATASMLRSSTPSAAHSAGRGDLLHAGVGLLVLLVVTTLNVYKPRGLTPYGWRQRISAISSSE